MNGFWALRRRLMYAMGFFIVVTLVGVYFFRNELFPKPTCFDSKLNGFEVDIDCGGECGLKCSQDIVPLSVSFVRAVKTSLNKYDLVAFINNKNIDNAPQKISYVFSVYDLNGREMLKSNGETIVPVGDFPIIRQGVSLPTPPGSVKVVISSNVPHYTINETPTNPSLRVTGVRYEAGSIPRVYATVVNQKRTSFRDIPVRTMLYDADGNVFAVGETIIPLLDKEYSKDIVFTWDSAFENPPVRMSVFPIFDPFTVSR